MEKEILKILKNNFNSGDINNARKELCFLFQVKREDEPICPVYEYNVVSNIGNYWYKDGMSGTEYRCDRCYEEFDFDCYA